MPPALPADRSSKLSRAGSAAPNAPDALERYRQPIERGLRRALQGREKAPYSLMRYHLGWEDAGGAPHSSRSGKLFRPALCLLCCEAARGETRRALPAAVALELLHNFSLIHDDLQDRSETRHGRQTVWRVWGEAQAINAGDGMFALAHVILLALLREGHGADRVVRAVRIFDETAVQLCEGQQLDLAGVAADRDIYLSMIEGKSAVLLAASCAIGALAGGADDGTVDALYEFGRRLGLAFQIRDDVLGIWGDPAETGKSAADDLRAGKRTFPVVVALEQASEEQRRQLEDILRRPHASDTDIERARALLDTLGAREESEQTSRAHAATAIETLQPLNLLPERKRELEQLARFAAERRA